jgi:hypothetical protein
MVTRMLSDISFDPEGIYDFRCNKYLSTTCNINGHRDPVRWPHDTLYLQKFALTSLTSGGRSVGIVRVRAKSHGV